MEESMTLFGSSKFLWVCKGSSSKFIGHLGTRPRKFSPALVYGFGRETTEYAVWEPGTCLVTPQAVITHGHKLN